MFFLQKLITLCNYSFFFYFNELNSIRVLQTFHHKLHSHGERFCTVDSNADAFVNLIIDLLNHHFSPSLRVFYIRQ